MNLPAFSEWLLVLIPAGLVCLAVRLLPLWGQPHRGCDAYYFLLCREAFRQQKRIPFTLPPCFVLEYEEQWYPPGFAVLLSLLPDKWLQRWYWVVSPVVDSLLGMCVAGLAFLFSGNAFAGLGTGVIYAFAPAAVAETQYLTSRQLGALLLTGTALCGVSAVHFSQPAFWGLSCGFGTLLLLTHKLSTQAFVISFLLLALLTGNSLYVMIPAAVFLSATLLSGGYYLKILRSHYDYIRLWTVHSDRMGAHQVEDSPVYGKLSDRYRVYRNDWHYRFREVQHYLIQNVTAGIPLAVVAAGLIGDAVPLFYRDLSYWSLSVLAVGLLSYLVPWLRGIGFMNQYGKLALPASLLTGAGLFHHATLQPVIIAVAVISLLQGIRWVQSLWRASRNGGAHWPLERMQRLFTFLQSLNNPLVMAIPNNYCDLLAYQCRIRVLWGAHGSPTRPLEMLLPVLSRRIEEICAEYGVTHLLLDTQYARPAQLGLTGRPVFRDGPWLVYDMRHLSVPVKARNAGDAPLRQSATSSCLSSFPSYAEAVS